MEDIADTISLASSYYSTVSTQSEEIETEEQWIRWKIRTDRTKAKATAFAEALQLDQEDRIMAEALADYGWNGPSFDPTAQTVRWSWRRKNAIAKATPIWEDLDTPSRAAVRPTIDKEFREDQVLRACWAAKNRKMPSRDTLRHKISQLSFISNSNESSGSSGMQSDPSNATASCDEDIAPMSQSPEASKVCGTAKGAAVVADSLGWCRPRIGRSGGAHWRDDTLHSFIWLPGHTCAFRSRAVGNHLRRRSSAQPSADRYLLQLTVLAQPIPTLIYL